MKLLAKYQNGNYTVRLFDDGTKIRMNNLDNLTPAFAESMDVTITEKCSGTAESPICKYCYLNCNETKPHGDLTNPIFDTVHAGTEMAINANDMTHPGLKDFLIMMKDKGVIVNLTINQKHLYDNLETLINWQNNDLIHGIGISLADSSDARLIPAIKQLKNVVMHVIDGCFTAIDLDRLADNNINLLILGYKIKGRGVEHYNRHKDEIEANIKYLSEHLLDYKNRYNGFAFDNLSTEHLDLKSKVSKDTWDSHYMGEEGAYTMFLDVVNNTYAISSMETKNVFPLKDTDTVDTIFKHIRKVAGHDK